MSVSWNSPFSLTGGTRTSRLLIDHFAERAGFAELAAGFLDIGALAQQIVVDRPPQAAIGDEVRGVGGLREVAARDLVLALRAGFDDLEAVLDREVDRLIVADLEMQERVVLDRTPVAAEQRIAADEVDRACDPPALTLGHYEQHVLGHAVPDQRKEFAVQIGPAPFARAGLHIEIEKRVPGVLGDIVAGEPVDGDASGCQGVPTFAFDRLAVPRIERAEEFVEAGKALIVPVELLVGSPQA